MKLVLLKISLTGRTFRGPRSSSSLCESASYEQNKETCQHAIRKAPSGHVPRIRISSRDLYRSGWLVNVELSLAARE
jgi:hypothetical protein